MKIYLVRHGEAAPYVNDDERPLSEKGRADIMRLAKFIAPLHIEVARIFHSEKLRARETASILGISIASKEAMQGRSELDPLADINLMMDEIYAYDEDILLVGHMPFMGKLVSKLVTGNENKEIIAFKAGTIICLQDMSKYQWVINWILSPEVF